MQIIILNLKRKERPESNGSEDAFIQERKEQRSLENSLERDISMILETMSVIQDDIKRSNKNTERQIKLSQEQTVSECTENFRHELAVVTSSIHELKVENEELRNLVDNLRKESERQKDEIADLKGAFKFDRLNAIEKDQYERINDIKIYGLVEKGGENGENSDQTIRAVRKLFRDKLNIEVRETDIDTAHRLGRFETDRERSVIVRFTRRTVKNDVIRNRKKLKDTPVIITDNLCPVNMKLYYRLKELVGGRNVWSIDGKIFAKVGNGQTKRVDIGNVEDIEREQREFIARNGDHRSTQYGDRDRNRGRGGRARGRYLSRSTHGDDEGRRSNRGPQRNESERGEWHDNAWQSQRGGGRGRTRDWSFGQGDRRPRGRGAERESVGREGRRSGRDISPFEDRDRDSDRNESPMREEGSGEVEIGAGVGGGGQSNEIHNIPVLGEGTKIRGFGRGRGKTP